VPAHRIDADKTVICSSVCDLPRALQLAIVNFVGALALWFATDDEFDRNSSVGFHSLEALRRVSDARAV